MVDVGKKAVVRRAATAAGRVRMAPETLALLREKALPKGDALNTARVAGVMAAKRTPELIPLCHGLNLTAVDVVFEVGEEEVGIVATARASDRTGVEMEALRHVQGRGQGDGDRGDQAYREDQGIGRGVKVYTVTKTPFMQHFVRDDNGCSAVLDFWAESRVSWRIGRA
jgi:molybdenum cofactor biosynthesis protein MoaC